MENIVKIPLQRPDFAYDEPIPESIGTKAGSRKLFCELQGAAFLIGTDCDEQVEATISEAMASKHSSPLHRARAMHVLALLHHTQNNYEQSLEALNKAEKFAQDEAIELGKIIKNRGIVKWWKGDITGALKEFRRVVNTDGVLSLTKCEAIVEEAKLRFVQKDWVQVIALVDEALEIDLLEHQNRVNALQLSFLASRDAQDSDNSDYVLLKLHELRHLDVKFMPQIEQAFDFLDNVLVYEISPMRWNQNDTGGSSRKKVTLPNFITQKRLNEILTSLRHSVRLDSGQRELLLTKLDIHGLTTLEASCQESRQKLFHTVVFGAPDEKSTLTKARAWLKTKQNVELPDEEKQIAAWIMQWLRKTHKIKTVYNSKSKKIDCNVDTRPANKGKIRFRFRKAGVRNEAIASPMRIPEELSLSR